MAQNKLDKIDLFSLLQRYPENDVSRPMFNSSDLLED